MRFVRMYTGPDNRSHFEDLKVPEAADGRGIAEIRLPPVTGALLRKGIRVGGGFQRAPLRQYVITLAGQIEIEVGNGSKRVFGPGDVLLAEDTHGEGHKVRVIGEEARIALSLPLA